jgi:hypothetical protein
MQGIYTYIPQTNHVPREYTVAAILSLLLWCLYLQFLCWLYCTFTLALYYTSSSSSSSSYYYYYYY